MARKLDLKTSITIERTPTGLRIKSDRGFRWDPDNIMPEVAMTAIIGNQLARSLEYENYFSNDFTITLKIEHKGDG